MTVLHLQCCAGRFEISDERIVLSNLLSGSHQLSPLRGVHEDPGGPLQPLHRPHLHRHPAGRGRVRGRPAHSRRPRGPGQGPAAGDER